MTLRVVAHGIENCPLVAGSVVVGVGWRHEPVGLEGLTHLSEHAHLLGSERYPDPDAAVEVFGAQLDGATEAEVTSYDFVCLREDAAPVLDVILDAAFRPTFDVERLAVEREIVRSAMNQESDFTPWEWAEMKLDDLLFETAQVTSMGTNESFARITRRHVIELHRRYHRAGLSSLCLAGDPDILAGLRAEVDIAEGERIPRAVPRPTERRAYHRPDEGQTPELFLGFRFAPEVYSPAVELLRVLVGNYPSSRLWRPLRTEEPLAYTVGSSLRHFGDGGRLALYVGMGDVALPAGVWGAVLSLIRDLRASGPSPQELRWAKRTARLNIQRIALDPERSVRNLVTRWPLLTQLPFPDADPYALVLDGLERQTEADVARAAAEVFRGENAALSVVGDTGDWSPEAALAGLAALGTGRDAHPY